MMESPKQEVKKRSEFLATQFERGEKYTYGSTTLEMFDIHPEKLKSEVPVFFGTGWSASRGVYETNILGLAERGRRVTTLFAPHGIDTEPGFGKGDKTYAAVELRKAAAMLRTLERKDIPQVDIVAHSEAAVWTLIAATMHPEKIRNIVLVDPAGLIGKDTLPRLGRSFSLDMAQEAINSAKHPRPKVERSVQPGSPTDLLGALKNIFGNPLLSMKEVLAISNADIRNMLEKLKMQGKHIAVVHGADDSVFPMGRMAGTKERSGAVTTKQVDGFYSVYGAHNELNANPEAYVHVINHALSALEALSKRDVATRSTNPA